MPPDCFAAAGDPSARGDSARAATLALLGQEAAAVAVALPDPATALRTVADGVHARAVVPFEDSRDGTVAATLDPLVFDLAGLAVVAEVDRVDDADVPRTVRWVVVMPAVDAPRPTADVRVQTLLFAVPHLNRPGALTEMLAAFSSRGLNVGRFEPRPLHAALGMYGFLLEVEGHPGDPWFAEALADLLAATSTLTHLGSFPAGERAWSAVTGRTPAGPGLRDRDDLASLVDRWTAS